MTAPSRVIAVTAGSLVLGIGVALLLFTFWLHLPASHAASAIRFLVMSGTISLLAGIAALLAISRFAPRLGLKIAMASLFGSAAAIVNILVTPLLMFKEQSDFSLLVVTLLYFLAISLAFASIVAAVMTRQIETLHEGASRLAAGEYGVTVPVRGVDEVADLTATFNRASLQLRDSFETQRRMEEERRDLFVSVSHDLRTPLSSIRAMIEAINDGVVHEPDAVNRYLHLVQRETEHLGHLIDDLFELARIESGNVDLQVSTVPLAELVTETVDSMRVHAQDRGINLYLKCDENLQPLTLDGPRMQRVLVNLIDNALRHTPAGGEVRVDLAQHGGRIELAVTDTGEGIAPDDQRRVFDRFYRAEKSRSRDTGGAGLGLAIARGLVEAQGGNIDVDSEPGKGARFVVRL